MAYLADLTLRLATGIAGLPEVTRDRHAAFFSSMQADDGGFTGREGPGDLYYTSFALRGLAMLGVLDDESAGRVARFLTEHIDRPMPSIDFLSLINSAVLLEMAAGIDVFDDATCDRRQTVIDFVERFRRDDGGYAKTKRSGQSSTYHTFLVAACREMVEAPLQRPERTIELIRNRQRDDGGFVELDAMHDGGTNPTAAAIGLLRLLDGLLDTVRAPAVDFLRRMQTPEGGLCANTRIPMPDLLSTFSGLVALSDLQSVESLDATAMRRFAQSLERPDGGFLAGTFDETADVEYTFYGLGTLALLS